MKRKTGRKETHNTLVEGVKRVVDVVKIGLEFLEHVFERPRSGSRGGESTATHQPRLPAWLILTQVARTEGVLGLFPEQLLRRLRDGQVQVSGPAEQVLDTFAQLAAGQGGREFLEGWRSQRTRLRDLLEEGDEEAIARLLNQMREWIEQDDREIQEQLKETLDEVSGSASGREHSDDEEVQAVESYLRKHWADLSDGRPMPDLRMHASDLMVEFGRLLRIRGRLKAARLVADSLDQSDASVLDRARNMLSVLDDLAG